MTDSFIQFLKKKEFKYNISDNSDLIIFKNEDNFNCVFMTDNGEIPYVRIVVPYLITEITDTDRPKILDFCNNINSDTKIGKAFIFENNLWIDAETLVSDTTLADGVFEFMLRIIKSSLRQLTTFLNDKKTQEGTENANANDNHSDR